MRGEVDQNMLVCARFERYLETVLALDSHTTHSGAEHELILNMLILRLIFGKLGEKLEEGSTIRRSHTGFFSFRPDPSQLLLCFAAVLSS